MALCGVIFSCVSDIEFQSSLKSNTMEDSLQEFFLITLQRIIICSRSINEFWISACHFLKI